MREALAGLTTRGRAFAAAGATAALCALVLGQRDLLRVAVLLGLLPLACALVVARTRYRVACTRVLQPVRVQAGEQARILLNLTNVSRIPTGLLLVEDKIPYVLGTRPRFVLDRLEPRGRRQVAYRVRSDMRGRYILGPLTIRLADPFGMCELTRGFTHRDTLMVTPAIQPLPYVRLGGEWSGGGDSKSRSVAASGEDDVAPRDYRNGDDRRRIHWRSTARYGDLMVRREEQPWQSRATILLDTRGAAHRGEGPGSSFEWSVSAVASIGVHLIRDGYLVRFVTDADPGVDTGAHRAALDGNFEGLLLDALAIVTPSANRRLDRVGTALRHGGADGLLIAVLGAIDTEQAATLAKLRQGTTVAIALLVDSMSWLHLPDDLRAEERKAFDAAAGLLRQTGWRVIPVRAGDELPPLWPQAARGGQEVDLPLDRIRTLTAAMQRSGHRAGRGKQPAGVPSGVKQAADEGAAGSTADLAGADRQDSNGDAR